MSADEERPPADTVDFAGKIEALIADEFAGYVVSASPAAEPLTADTLAAAFALLEQAPQPQPIILPPPPDWMAEHDDEPRVIVCPPDRAELFRVAVELYGREAWYIVQEDTAGVLPPGDVFIMAPGLLKLGPLRTSLFGEPTVDGA